MKRLVQHVTQSEQKEIGHHIVDNKLIVAAEAKAFLPLGWVPEWDVASLKEAGWNHDARTIFKGVRKVRKSKCRRVDIILISLGATRPLHHLSVL